MFQGHFLEWFLGDKLGFDSVSSLVCELHKKWGGEGFCCCSEAKLCLTLCNHMDCSTQGFFLSHSVCSNSCPLNPWWEGFKKLKMEENSTPPSHTYIHKHNTSDFVSFSSTEVVANRKFFWLVQTRPRKQMSESACNAGELGLIPGWGRSSGEGNGNPLQYSCLGNSMDTGSWVVKGQTWLSD